MTPAPSQLLFVDDDANIITSIRRVLRGNTGNWQLHCANSGQEALDVARTIALDAVVTDMRMPVMDGATLLSHVHELQPNAVRMVLSGQSDRDYSIAAAKHAHRFLAKPCQADELSEHIRSTLEARSRLNAIGASDLVGLGPVCVENDVLVDLGTLVSSAPFNPARVCKRTREHSEVVLKLLQFVSSSFFNPRRPTVLSREAITTLGPDVLRSLLGSDLFQPIAEERRNALVECHQTAWRTASFAERIAGECQLPSKDRELLSSAAQLINVNQALRLGSGPATSIGSDTWRNVATNAAESTALLQLLGVPEALTQVVTELTIASTERPTTLYGSILVLAVALTQGAPSAECLPSDFPRAALESVLTVKSLETWTNCASNWSLEEAGG